MVVICQACKSAITPKKSPGVSCCGTCKQSFHFTCAKLAKDSWALYADKENPKPFLCISCTKNHRKSLSISQLPDTVTTQRAPITFEEYISLQQTLKSLQEAVTQLTLQLTEAKEEIANLKTGSQRSTQLNPITRNPQDRGNGMMFFTINGVSQTDGEEVRDIVTKVVSAKVENFTLDESTHVKRLKTKTQGGHTILIKVKKTSDQYKTFKSVQRTKLAGSEVGLESEMIYINESHTTDSYRLYKKAKGLLAKVVKYVWIRNSRVLIRYHDNGPVEHLCNDTGLEKVLETCGRMTE